MLSKCFGRLFSKLSLRLSSKHINRDKGQKKFNRWPLEQWVEFFWYTPESKRNTPFKPFKKFILKKCQSYLKTFFVAWLLCFSGAYKIVIYLRKKAYNLGILKSFSVNVPVIVVGNLTVGGTGKTPLVIALAAYLKQGGYRPGIISRGYGGKSASYPLKVTEKTTAREAGDEAVLLAYRTQCPVVVAPKRMAAVDKLVKESKCNIILSDDGLQHLAMKRDLEIMVIDGKRRFGNQHCLPAGPLREPLARYKTVDFRVTNGIPQKGEYGMSVKPENFICLANNELFNLAHFEKQVVNVVTGIGNPERFFSTLDSLKLDYKSHIFPDHHIFCEKDLLFYDKKPIIMTEKDAVKCKNFKMVNNIYYLKVEAKMDESFKKDFLSRLNKLRRVPK